MRFICAFVLICETIHTGIAARILGFFSLPSFSHQIVFQSIWKELSLRGHNVTAISPNILNDSNFENLEEIHVPQAYDVYNIIDLMTILPRNGSNFQKAVVYPEFARISTEIVLTHKEVRALMTGDEHFDLIIIQAMNPLSFAVAAKFRVPFIGKLTIL